MSILTYSPRFEEFNVTFCLAYCNNVTDKHSKLSPRKPCGSVLKHIIVFVMFIKEDYKSQFQSSWKS
jgi:hypothetical protein